MYVHKQKLNKYEKKVHNVKNIKVAGSLRFGSVTLKATVLHMFPNKT